MIQPTTLPPMPGLFLEKIRTWPDAAAQRFSELRYLVLNAGLDANVGEICESLKWSEPAWRPIRPRQGSTLRLSWSVKSPDQISLFVDCKTTLASTMQSLYPADFKYENNRALRLHLDADLPRQAIDHLARLTFTYHAKKAARHTL